MKTENKHALRCLATGVIVLILFVVLMSWFSSLCAALQSEWNRTSLAEERVHLSPLPLLPDALESDPNIAQRSSLSVTPRRDYIQELKTIAFDSPMPLGDLPIMGSDVYQWRPPEKGKSEGMWLYFDRTLGLIVHRNSARTFDSNLGAEITAQWYAGPEGMAQTPEKSLGRFETPIGAARNWWGNTCVYDAKVRRFFTIDWRRQLVTKGPQLSPEDRHQPVQIGELGKARDCFYVNWQAPMREVGKDTKGDPNLKEVVYLSSWAGRDDPLPVLDASGRIDMLDRATLTLAGPVAALPRIPGTFDATEGGTLDGFFAYSVTPLWLWPPNRPNEKPLQYLGCVVAALDRDAMELSVRIFDSEGKLVGPEGMKKVVQPLPGFWITKHFIEDLHPPVLLILSEITAPYIEAQAGAHDLFLLPNSYMAHLGRSTQDTWVVRLALGLGVISPALIFVAILAWLIARDARFLGVSRRARVWWVLATAVFGLPACITYLTLRPPTVLVTCRNCGRLRRPDQERCHQCGSPWEVPELNPPAWRVFDGAASGLGNGSVKSLAAAEQKPDSSVNTM